VGRLRERITTTPGKLALLSVLVVAGAVFFGTLATAAERSRAGAAQEARAGTEPLLLQAVTLNTALSDANATAATTFLKGGLEPVARRAHYLDDLRLASDALVGLTRGIGGSTRSRAEVRTIAQQLPVYSGLVEAARADNRQGLPIGAAYLRQASALLTRTILPAANQLYATEARRLSGDYASGTATAALLVLALVAAASLGFLVLTQTWLARMSRRILNLPMLLASCVLTAVSMWALVGLVAEQNALTRARRAGSDSVEILSATRVLLSRTLSDESLTLVNRGSDVTDPTDFTRVMMVLAPPGGLVGQVAVLARRTGPSAPATQLASDFAAYRAEAARVGSLERRGQILTATNLASSPGSAAITDRLSGNLAAQIAAAQTRFARAAADATSALSGLTLVIPVLTVIVAGLALEGLRRRLLEYR
jgi:hypothetical protein